ncbi:MAG: ABC transporter ATP-binding protein/permease [Tannerellaceae bacterium]|jgi:ATP-binding cassette subfamily B protein|nr:ABC transporter ATP-binding protein/permease [Tannerellaceae bacterium]
MKKYWEILERYKISLAISPFLILIAVLSETVQPLFMARIIDDGVIQRDLLVVSEVGLHMVLISLAGLLFSVANIYISSKTSIGFGTDLRTALFDKIQQLTFNDIDRFNSASLITRLTSDITRIQHIVLMSMRILLRAPMMLVMTVFFVVRINTGLAMILLVSIPVLSISVYLILRKGFPLFLKVQQQLDRLNGVVRENLINIRVVKSFVREGFEAGKFAKSSDDLRDLVIKASNTVVTMFPVMQLVMNLSLMAILWFGGNKVVGNEIKVGELISFVNYLTQVLMSLMMLSVIIMAFVRASASSERIVEVLNAKPSLVDPPAGLAGSHRIREGRVAFRNVSFRYEGGEEDVLQDVTFEVNQGETIAVVGATGSAKSSMVQLIPRLYDVTKGEVSIDNINVKDYHSDELHCKIGMVLQKNELFTGTIADNLRWGKQGATQPEIEAAARAAEAHDFILSFPEGYDTMLGRGGVNVSGGQKQRLCIARALLGKPKILILDDSTSAVDTETELRIRRNLNALLADTTVFIITQRVHTMQSADRVIVLEDGRVEAVGKPDELIRTSEVYKEIYYSQQITLQ